MSYFMNQGHVAMIPWVVSKSVMTCGVVFLVQMHIPGHIPPIVEIGIKSLRQMGIGIARTIRYHVAQ